MLLAWSSPFIVKITQDKENYNITEDEAFYFTVLPPIVMVLSCPIFTRLSDQYGRKTTLLLIAVPQIFSWLLKAFAKDVYVFYLARCFYGLADGIIYASLPMYIGEITTPRVRGRWGNMMTFTVYFGQFLINLIGQKLSVADTSTIALAVPIMFLSSFPFMPESPYYFLMHKREEDARSALQWLRGKKDVSNEFSELKKAVDRQMSQSGSWKDLFTIKSNQKALYAGIFLRISQLLSGVSVFLVYTRYIFEKTDAYIIPESATLVCTGLWFALNVTGGILIDHLGRRKSYITSLFLCSIVLWILALYFFIDYHATEDLVKLRWIPLAGFVSYTIFCAIGLALIPTLMLGELFSTSVKAKGTSVVILFMGTFQFLTNYLFYVLNSSSGFYAPFMFFAVCAMCSVVLSFYFVPETSGKTLEEIQQTLKDDDDNNI